MLDFLEDYGIQNEVILEMEKVNTEANIFNFNSNEYDVGKIIKFFRELGINCIDDLLVNKIDLFFLRFDDIKKLFYKYDLYKLVELINKDYNIVDKL